MEFRHLRYFLVLAQELHFSRAAERLAISQPPLSWNIRQLEDSLGARLFERNSRGVRLTEAGRAFVPAAQALLAQADDAARLARDVEGGVRGSLRVGYVSSMLYRDLPRLLHDFGERHPEIRVRSFELNSQAQVVELSHGRIDVGFLHSSQLPHTLHAEPFSADPFLCCLPRGHALARSRVVDPAALKGETFVMFAREASPDYHERVLTICTSAGFSPDIRHEVRHWPSVVTLVARGLGVALVPEAVRHASVGKEAVFVHLTVARVLSQANCVWRAGDHSAALKAFLDEARTAAGGRRH